jgi:DNA-binding NtrC family response regulator
VDSNQTSVATLPVIVVADDLIWSSRLRTSVERAGTTALNARSARELSTTLQSAPAGSAVIVDLNGRAYDGVDAVRTAAVAGHRVLAVGQHEDLQTRKLALAAGAKRVFSYNKLFSDGPAVVAALLEGNL